MVVCLLVIVLFLPILSASSSDPYRYGSQISQLAKSKGLNFISEAVTKTFRNNQIIVYGLTALEGKTLNNLKGNHSILINSLMHPREKASFNMLKEITEELIVQYSSDPQITFVLQNSVVWFLPYTNIDGVEEFEKLKSQVDKEQMRKNMNFQASKKCKRFSKGVDINRNFDYNYGTIYTSKDPCSIEYRGVTPFSEKQSQAIKTMFEQFNITLAIDIHSYGNLWIYPFASSKDIHLVQSHPLFYIYESIFQMFQQNKIKYKGCYESLGYLADGVYIDWALSKNAISFAFEIGEDFADEAFEQANKRVGEFIQVIKINAPKYRLLKTQKEICITSLSMVPFSFWIGLPEKFQNKYSQLPAKAESSCIPLIKEAQTYELRIKQTGKKEEINVQNVEKQRDNDESNYWLWLMLKGSAIFIGGGMICGLSVCCETLFGKIVFPQNLEQKEKLTKSMEEEISEGKDQRMMIRDDEEQED